jgi:hypothetical protein
MGCTGRSARRKCGVDGEEEDDDEDDDNEHNENNSNPIGMLFLSDFFY